MSNPSQILSNLDFDTLKNTFKAYLRGQERYSDYDFEGSNFSVLLDLLAYNTYMNSFYLNMVGNEMFLDTAQLRDSVVSHAKELNYIPRSFTSSKAVVDITVVSNSPTKRNISIPKGTSFTARTSGDGGPQNYTFTTDRNIVITNKVSQTANSATFVGEGIELYEGSYVSDSYSFVNGSTQRVLITNPTADISSLKVTVIEDSGATSLEYTRADSLFGLDETSKVYFLQGAENYGYEVLFGDNVTGRQPKNNSVVLLEYRTCNGELPNGLSVFQTDGTIDSESNITITTVTKSSGGFVAETIESIKFNAPRAFTTQERAVTTEDFENLLKQNYPEINAVSAFGGEQLDPPQFGKVFVAVDLKETDFLPRSKKDEYYNFLKPRSIVSIDPVFLDPDYVYVAIDTKVKYNINVTQSNGDDIRTMVLTAISNFAASNLDSFNKTLRYSKLINAIDSASSGIVSNETDIIGVKRFTPTLNSNDNYKITFGYELKQYADEISTDHSIPEEHVVTSSYFTYNNKKVYLEDDGEGTIQIVAAGHTAEISKDSTIVAHAGTVDYTNGVVYLNSFNISGYDGAVIKIYAKPKSKDITSTKDIILNVLDEDVNIDVEPIRE